MLEKTFHPQGIRFCLGFFSFINRKLNLHHYEVSFQRIRSSQIILTPAVVSTQHVSYNFYMLETRCCPWLGCLSTHLFSYIFWQSQDPNERYLVAWGPFSWFPIIRFAYGCFQQTDWARLVQFVTFSTTIHFVLLAATMFDSLGCRIWEVLVCKVSCQFVFFETSLALDHLAWDTMVCGSTEKTYSKIL